MSCSIVFIVIVLVAVVVVPSEISLKQFPKTQFSYLFTKYKVKVNTLTYSISKNHVFFLITSV